MAEVTETRSTEDQHLVTWRECECDWITKYCDDNHVKHAVIPGRILRDYAAALAEEREKARAETREWMIDQIAKGAQFGRFEVTE